MHMKKCITIHLLLGNIRPRIRYLKMQILWSFQGDLHQDSTIELLGACSTRIHSNVLRNDRQSLHVVPTTRYMSQTKRQGKRSMTGWGGGINRTASPTASLPPRHCFLRGCLRSPLNLPPHNCRLFVLNRVFQRWRLKTTGRAGQSSSV